MILLPVQTFLSMNMKLVKSTVDMRVPKEDDPRRGSCWTAEEMMEDFEDFVATVVRIAGLLPSSDLTK